jgi:hypothetical protein
MTWVSISCFLAALLTELLPNVYVWVPFIISFFGVVSGMFVLITNAKFGLWGGWFNMEDTESGSDWFSCSNWLGNCGKGGDNVVVAAIADPENGILLLNMGGYDNASDVEDDGEAPLVGDGSEKLKVTSERAESFFGGWLCDPRPHLMGWFVLWNTFEFTVFLAQGAATALQTAPLPAGSDPAGLPVGDFQDNVRLMAMVLLPLTAVILTLISYFARSMWGLIACIIAPVAIAVRYKDELLWLGVGPAIFAAVVLGLMFLRFSCAKGY